MKNFLRFFLTLIIFGSSLFAMEEKTKEAEGEINVAVRSPGRFFAKGVGSKKDKKLKKMLRVKKKFGTGPLFSQSILTIVGKAKDKMSPEAALKNLQELKDIPNSVLKKPLVALSTKFEVFEENIKNKDLTINLSKSINNDLERLIAQMEKLPNKDASKRLTNAFSSVKDVFIAKTKIVTE